MAEKDNRPFWQQFRDKKLKVAHRGTGLGQKKEEDQDDQPENSDNSENSEKEKPEKKAPPKKKAPKKKAMKQRGKKHAKTMRTLAINYDPYLEKNPICVIMSPVCTHKATCVNHKAGRGVNAVLDKKTWEPACSPCNDYIEAHHEWAQQNGHKTTRLEKPKKFKDAGI